MKRVLLFISIITVLSCKTDIKQGSEKQTIEVDNTQLIEIYQNDQNDRMSDNRDWSEINKNDSIRRVRVRQLLDSGKVKNLVYLYS